MHGGFTLLELLVVVAIIGLLVGMLAGGIQAVRNGMKRQKASMESKTIAQALRGYRDDFGEWPKQDETVVADVTCSDEAGQRLVLSRLLENVRKRVYLDIPGGSDKQGAFLDPWLRPYVITMDMNSDGLCDVNAKLDQPAATYVTNVASDVAVFSWGASPATTNSVFKPCSWR